MDLVGGIEATSESHEDSSAWDEEDEDEENRVLPKTRCEVSEEDTMLHDERYHPRGWT